MEKALLQMEKTALQKKLLRRDAVMRSTEEHRL
jgi:hypothetical protein